jgi:hypothetical protein
MGVGFSGARKCQPVPVPVPARDLNPNGFLNPCHSLIGADSEPAQASSVARVVILRAYANMRLSSALAELSSDSKLVPSRS